jgi:hypothetical protein
MEISESGRPGVASDLTDLTECSLSDVADAVKAGDAAPEETLRRVAPSDGTQLLVAASFNSAI